MIVVGVVIAIVVTSPWEKVVVDEIVVPDVRVETFQGMLVGGNAVFVDDQKSGSQTVVVGFVVSDGRSYIEIHADDDGVPGKVIGTSDLLPVGGAEHFEVQLSEPLIDHAIYYAFVVDENKRPVTDALGNVILMSFAARADAEPETEAIQP